MIVRMRATLVAFSLSALGSGLQGQAMITQIARIFAGVPERAVEVMLGVNLHTVKGSVPDTQLFRQTLAESFAASLRPYSGELSSLKTVQYFSDLGDNMRKECGVLLVLTSPDLDRALAQPGSKAARDLVLKKFTASFAKLYGYVGMDPDSPYGSALGRFDSLKNVGRDADQLGKEVTLDPELRTNLVPTWQGIMDEMSDLLIDYYASNNERRPPPRMDVFAQFETLNKDLLRLDVLLRSLASQVEVHLKTYGLALASIPGLGDNGPPPSPEGKEQGTGRNLGHEQRK